VMEGYQKPPLDQVLCDSHFLECQDQAYQQHAVQQNPSPVPNLEAEKPANKNYLQIYAPYHFHKEIASCSHSQSCINVKVSSINNFFTKFERDSSSNQ